MSDWKTAYAPATIANVGPGFDVLGLALDPEMGLGDTCSVRLAAPGTLDLTIEGDGGRLPRDPLANVATVAALAVLKAAGRTHVGLQLRLTKGLPLCSGLGSSAASAASAAVATNEALGNPLVRRELLDAGRAGEALAAGFPHPDNVVPALLGGFLLMVEDDETGLHVVRLPVPASLAIAVVIPELSVATSDARAAIPDRVPVADAVYNAGRIALLVSGLYEGDLNRVAFGVQDRLHQPYRTPMVPGYDDAKAAALAAGALCVGLSGSGPAMFAFSDGPANAEASGRAMAAAFERRGTGARFAVGRVGGPSE